MRFRRVPSAVMVVGGGTATIARSDGRARSADSVRTGAPPPTEVALRFALAWMAEDHTGMERWSMPDLVCRWIGFEADTLVAHGLPEALRIGRAFEVRHGKASRYSVEDSLAGARHAALLFEIDELPPGTVQGVRIAVYRVAGDRVEDIAVYADRLV
jgi:hypothetical protein